MAGNWCSSCSGAGQLLWRVTQRQLAHQQLPGPRRGSRGGSPDSGGARLGLSFAPLPPAPPPPLLFYSHSLPASTQSVEPPAGQESAGGVSSSLIKSHEREIFSVSREETPAQFGEKLKALPAETRNLRSRKQNLHFWHSVISCWIKTYHDTIFELG